MKRLSSILPLRVTFMFLVVCLAASSFGALQDASVISPSLTAPPDGNGDSWSPIISPDGRYLLFASTANNLALAGGSNALSVSIPLFANVYLRDRLNGTTTLVSVNLAGTDGADANAYPTGLSTNGQYVLFESAATNLVANDTIYTNKVFRRDVISGITSLVSVTPGGTNGNGVSRSSTMTPDGRYVAFVSAATNLVANDTNGIPDIFMRDMQAGTTVLTSMGATSGGILGSPIQSGIIVSNTSEAPEITPDGRYVAFYSSATNLVQGITNIGEIYVRDLVGGTTFWASTNAQIISGLNGAGGCFNQAISDNGQYVAFEICSNSSASSSGYVLRNNLQTGFTDIISTNAAVPAGLFQTKRSLNLTPDGQTVVYTVTNGNASAVYLWNAQAGTNTLISGNPTNGITPGASVYWPDVDPSGRYVLFFSSDTNLTGTTNGGDLFLRDTQAGVTTLVSVDTNGFNLLVDSGAMPALSTNGPCVAFESPHANLDGRNYFCDVFFRNVSSNASELVSAHAPALPSVSPNGPSTMWPGSLSANARYVAFSSWANNLAANDNNTNLNIFVRDLAQGQNFLASGTNGACGNSMSTQPSISGNGRYVAFASISTNLVAGDSSPYWQIFVRDLAGGTNTLVSVATTGGFGNGDSLSPAISSDGRYVLFTSLASNLAAGSYTASPNLFLRDLKLSETYAVTTGSFSAYAATPDDHSVAFIGAGDVNVYVWSLSTASLTYTNTGSSFTSVSISPDGRWIAYYYTSGFNELFAANLVALTNCLITNSAIIGLHAGMQFSSDDRFLAYAFFYLGGGTTNSVYLHDFLLGTDTLISQSPSGAAENGASDSPVISPDGRFVAYRSLASNLVPGASNTVPQLFLYDRINQTNLVASSNPAGGTSNNRSLSPIFSSDSLTLGFESWASDLVPQDFNSAGDVFTLNMFGFESGLNQTNSVAGLQPQVILPGQPGMPPGENLLVMWPVIPGASSYNVQYKNNLFDPAWLNLNGNITVIGNEIYFTDPSPASAQRFYRIGQTP